MRFLGRISGASAWGGGWLEARLGKGWGMSLARARVLEDAEIDGFLVWPYAPGYCMLGFDIDPTDKI